MKSQKFYMFGYGSLINQESRSKTAQTGPSIPVILHDIQRHLSLDKDWGLVCVGAQKEVGKKTNGVLVEISDKAFKAYEKRESFYEVEWVDTTQIEFLGKPQSVKKIFYWKSPKIFPPNKNFPICQSYLDVILTGCQEIDRSLGNSQADFLKQFIKTTQGWAAPWKNDRQNPQYSRPLNYKKIAPEALEQIDQFLKEALIHKLA